MRKVQRWRYYCDFCTKAGQSGFHMKNHEASCTKNPNRECKMCVAIDGGSAATIPEMLALLPDPAKYMMTITPDDDEFVAGEPFDMLDDEAIKPVVEAAMPALRELVQNCPVCIMAALRQKGIPVPIVESFKFKDEMKQMFSDINDAREERYY